MGVRICSCMLFRMRRVTKSDHRDGARGACRGRTERAASADSNTKPRFLPLLLRLLLLLLLLLPKPPPIPPLPLSGLLLST
jgi:hypothetical protein